MWTSICSIWLAALVAFTLLLLGLYLFFVKIDADLTLYLYDILGNPTRSLSKKVVWITGSSSGIGEHLAYDMASCGARLVLSGTNRQRLEIVKDRCVRLYGLSDDDVLVLPFDMCSLEEHSQKLEDIIQHFGKLDILVNNAGRSQRAKFLDIDLDVDRQMFELNVFSTLNLTRVVLPHFLKNGGGHVAVTSSCVGKMGAAGSASYTGSKHALHGYFETLRTELYSQGIRVSILCPGPVFSNFLQNAFTDVPGEKFGGQPLSTDKRMATARCARLMTVAIAYKLDEAWIAIQPCLILYYLAQYTPSFFRTILIEKYYTPERALKLREGRW